MTELINSILDLLFSFAVRKLGNACSFKTINIIWYIKLEQLCWYICTQGRSHLVNFHDWNFAAVCIIKEACMIIFTVRQKSKVN